MSKTCCLRCSLLQETFEAGMKLLPRSSVVHLMRLSMRATAAAIMKAFTPAGVRSYNLHAVERLLSDVAAVERFAGRWGVPALSDELAEPTQLCRLLLSNNVSIKRTRDGSDCLCCTNSQYPTLAVKHQGCLTWLPEIYILYIKLNAQSCSALGFAIINCLDNCACACAAGGCV